MSPSWPRRAILAVLFVLFSLLALFPQKYRSAVSLAPSDPATLGLGGAISQLGAGSSVFGNQAAVEVTNRVAASVIVRNVVIDKLDLIKALGVSNRLQASRWLDRNIDIRSIRGGIVQMEVSLSDPVFAESLISAYAEATRQRLAYINRQQTSYKRQVLEQLVKESDDRLDRAQAAYDAFRLQTRYSDPRAAISAIGERIPALEAAIKAKEVQLSAARQFATDDNMAVRQVVAELDALRSQLSVQRTLDPTKTNSVGRVVKQSTAALRLERDLSVARILNEGYRRYLQGTAVEDLTSSANLRVIEPPFIDTARQVKLPFVALAALVLLLGLATEFYLLRPPLESRRTG